MSKGNPAMRLPKDTQAALRILAAQNGIPVGEVLEELLKNNASYQAAKRYLKESSQEIAA